MVFLLAVGSDNSILGWQEDFLGFVGTLVVFARRFRAGRVIEELLRKNK
jgi:hypothetical protein